MSNSDGKYVRDNQTHQMCRLALKLEKQATIEDYLV